MVPRAIWGSDDGGASWTQVVGAGSVGGIMYAVDASNGVIVAAGDGGNGDLTAPPAIVMLSSDGLNWERNVLDADAVARSVAVGPSGRIVVAGHRNTDLLTWVSDDTGATWEGTITAAACCAADIVATPNGYVIAADGAFEGALLSSDAMTWQQRQLDSALIGVDWGPHFGLTGASKDRILLGPVPAP